MIGPIVPKDFTPWASLGGGILIGLSAVMVMALLGRVAGIAGISSGALGARVPLGGSEDDHGWRLAFIRGLVAAPLAYALAGGSVEQTVSGNLAAMASAGLLVGLGTGLGSGCTSGHGICGIARLSRRSFVAVAIFMTAGFVTVFLVRHLAGGL